MWNFQEAGKPRRGVQEDFDGVRSRPLEMLAVAQIREGSLYTTCGTNQAET